MTTKTFLLWCYFVVIVLPGCNSMQEINNYSKISLYSLNNINSLQYSFQEYCTRNCELEKRRYQILDTTVNCSCLTSAKKADSTIYVIYSVIKAYMEAVEKLSNNSSFQYDASALASAIQSNSFIQVTELQKNTINKAGNFLATIGTSYYRKKTLKKYIAQADSIFAELIETFIFLIDKRLRQQLELDFTIHKSNLSQMFDNTDSNNVIRQFIIKEMIEENNWYIKQNILLTNYSDLLKKIKNGHHQIYLERERLADKSFIHLIQRYSTEIKSIMESVQQ